MKFLGLSRRLSALAALAALAGCGKVYSYPESVAEADATLCQNGVDDDFDDQTDCADSDCTGFCSESTPADCGDGVDDDGDSLIDAADPSCWPLLPPTATRCAKAAGAEVVVHFDVPPRLADGDQGFWDADWASWGFDGDQRLVTHRPHTGPSRRDLMLTFEGNTAGTGALGTNLGAFVRQQPFAGSVQDFALEFHASVPPGTIVRAGIVPMGLAPSTSAPLAGAEAELVSVTLDASRSPATLAIDADHLHYEIVLESAETGCDDASRDGCMGRVRLAFESDDFVATFVDAAGKTSEVRAPAPNSSSLPASRLVLWGGGSAGAPRAAIDDLRLSVAPALPCGFAVPQIPGEGCDTVLPEQNWGYTVSVAKQGAEFCALVPAAVWDDKAERLGPPSVLGVWTSGEGAAWRRLNPSFVSELHTDLIGASLAADGAGLHTVIAHRDRASGAAYLSFVDATDCDTWQASTPGPALPDDAEAPSYVITRALHEVYFTRTPAESGRRQLFRIVRGDENAVPELVGELPAGVEAPISIQRAGKADLVLTAPSRSGSGGRGVLLFVSSGDLGDWKRVGDEPVLRLPPSIDLPSGAGRLAFDDREVISAALAWDSEGGFLLYGGRSSEGGVYSGDVGTPILAAGTARLSPWLPPGQASPQDPPLVPQKACGDELCASSEDCVSCQVDCPCAGLTLAEDLLSEGTPWTVISSAPDPRAIRYFRQEPPALHFAAGEPTWSALALDHPIDGDFELSFDVRLDFSSAQSGQVYVGLGTEPIVPSPSLTNAAAPAAGIFARSTNCSWSFNTAATALSAGVTVENDSVCFQEDGQVLGATQHVLLRREGNAVSVTTPAWAWTVPAQGRAVCSSYESSVVYPGGLPPLTHLLVGFGGDGFAPSPEGGSSGAISNLKLGLARDPAECPPPREACVSDGEQPNCVDTSQSNEHCGACGHRCGSHETCVAGACTCRAVASIMACGSACVDLESSRDHCGSCDRACEKACLAGLCDSILGGTCSMPFEVPPDGGTFPIVFPATWAAAQVLCDGLPVVNETIGAWTPSTSGTAVLRVDVGEQDLTGGSVLDSVLAITEDLSCSSWLGCNDDIVSGGILSSELNFPVVAGTTYRIGIGLWDYRPSGFQTVTLEVGFE